MQNLWVLKLKGWKLEFRGMENSALATIAPEQNREVYAILWDLKQEDEKALDKYEGYPYLYRKEFVKVLFKGKPVKAMVYIMNPGRKLGKPGDRYYTAIWHGYRAAAFDISILIKNTILLYSIDSTIFFLNKAKKL